jgi:hypothetical protein
MLEKSAASRAGDFTSHVIKNAETAFFHFPCSAPIEDRPLFRKSLHKSALFSMETVLNVIIAK